jgi:hypothetical protein
VEPRLDGLNATGVSIHTSGLVVLLSAVDCSRRCDDLHTTVWRVLVLDKYLTHMTL